MLKNNQRTIFLVLAITTFIIFFNLGAFPLLDPDEPVYAETPKEMITYNDFISPRIYGEYWYDKPPMYYWLVAAAFKTFGVNEFAARFPSALLAVLCVMMIYRTGTKLFGSQAGMAAALVLATSIEYFYVAKGAVTDITLTIFLSAALLAFIERKYYLFYVCAALATLTKGPVGLLFPGAIVFFYLMATWNWREIRNMKIPAGIIIYSLIALPWYIVMYQLHGAVFLDTFIGFHNITRFTTAEHSKTAVWYFFIPVLLLGFFPWTAMLVQSIRASLREGIKRQPALLFFNVWAAFIFAFFTLSNTKLVTYILPMYPPLALIVGWYIGKVLPKDNQKSLGLGWPVMLTILVILLLGGLYAGIKAMPILASSAVLIGAIFILMAAIVWNAILQRKPMIAFWGQVVAMTTVAVILVAIMIPTMVSDFSTRDLAHDFNAVYDGKSQVYIVKFLHPGFTFYTDVYGNEVKSREELSNAINNNSSGYFIIGQSEYKGLGEKDRDMLKILAQSGKSLLLQKRYGE